MLYWMRMRPIDMRKKDSHQPNNNRGAAIFLDYWQWIPVAERIQATVVQSSCGLRAGGLPSSSVERCKD
ncbi:hypothetical protein ASPCADRAFT_208586 [Aspergillus carbonarius ITEM 5010]|uniref:Uncharacterized protein n=1 Tax=Aspergillus carbonarius (strain ITEM 5010) TaxID=602072 RepID=A0A1R3RKC8_ASPC5|nr:hypothetical protein ASPCADRAFT_208586 [Aspergillus carbonarius ITEM 5010]